MTADPGSKGARPNARTRAAAAREQQRKRENRRKFWIIGGAVGLIVVIVVVMVVVAANKSGKKQPNAAASTVASPQVVKQVSTVEPTAFEKAGTGAVTGGVTGVTGPGLTIDGKPGVLYLGADYCPYCAAQRWPLVIALSRFGTWSNLGQTTSASQDVYPNTPTFSFYGSNYSSPYVGFQGVETATNQPEGDHYGKLQTPTSEQTALVEKYNSKGSIPFVDINNRYVTVGATYDPKVLQGKSFEEIAAAATDPTTDIGKAVLGSANVYTGAICNVNGGKPASVCDTPAIQQVRSKLK